MLDFNKYRSRADGQSIELDIAEDHHSGSLTNILDAGEWQDSATISRLLIYLKEHGSAAGIKLCQLNGELGLTFSPSLGCADMKTERWQIAQNAVDLLHAATQDLKIMISRGVMVPLWVDGNEAGPSRGS